MAQSNTEKTFNPLTDRENYLAKVVVDSAFLIHKALGPGLLERIGCLINFHVPLMKDGFKRLIL
jgi:hypothetical protein